MLFNDLSLLLDLFRNSEGTKLLILTVIFCLVFTAPEKWRVELRAKTGHYRNRCFFTLKWHPKQQHLFLHPFRSLQCIRFVEKNFFFVANKLTNAYLMWGRGGGWIFNYAPFWGPLEFWLDQTGTCTTWLWGLQYNTIVGSLWYLATEEMR